MPSRCENWITITTGTEEEMAVVLAALRGPNGPFDFEAIRPAPVALAHGVSGHRSFEVEGRTVTVERWRERCDGGGRRPRSPALDCGGDRGVQGLVARDPLRLAVCGMGFQMTRAECRLR